MLTACVNTLYRATNFEKAGSITAGTGRNRLMKNWISSRRGLIAGGALVSVAGMMMGASRAVATPEGTNHSKNIDLILTFCKAGQDRNLEKQMSYIDEDSIYHKMRDAPIAARAGIRAC